MIRVLLADDHEVVRLGFRMIIDGQPDLEVVGETAPGAAAVTAAVELRPDLMLMDVRMHLMDGIAATQAIVASCPEVRVLVVTTFDLDDYVVGALRAGAAGFVLKNVEPAALIEAIHTLVRGDSLVAPAVTQIHDRLRGASARRTCWHRRPPGAALSERERVLTSLARGLSNRRTKSLPGA